jgi:hypothetical protein
MRSGISSVFLITMFVDVSIRTCLLLIHNKTRRNLYESITRISVANIYFGMFVLLIESNRATCLGCLALPPAIDVVHNSYISLFAVSFSIVVIKAFAINDWIKRALVGLSVIITTPTILLFASTLLLATAGAGVAFLTPSPEGVSVGLMQQFTRCTLPSGKIVATGLLSLYGMDTVAIDPHSFWINYGSDLTSRGDIGQPPIILFKSKPISVTIVATLDPDYQKYIPSRLTEIDCDLALPGGVSDSSKFVNDVVPVRKQEQPTDVSPAVTRPSRSILRNPATTSDQAVMSALPCPEKSMIIGIFLQAR